MLTDASAEAVALSCQETEMARESGQAIANFITGDGCVHLILARETGEQI
jgi:hypothetical protein